MCNYQHILSRLYKKRFIFWVPLGWIAGELDRQTNWMSAITKRISLDDLCVTRVNKSNCHGDSSFSILVMICFTHVMKVNESLARMIQMTSVFLNTLRHLFCIVVFLYGFVLLLVISASSTNFDYDRLVLCRLDAVCTIDHSKRNSFAAV